MIIPLAQITVSDGVTIALIIGGIQAVLGIGDRLWKRPKGQEENRQSVECTVQHSEIKGAIASMHTEQSDNMDRMITAIDRFRSGQEAGLMSIQVKQQEILGNVETLVRKANS